ncbi:MAG: hypothetical protein ACT4NP_20300 [Pseudonocardiales bacterium]
MPTVDGEAYGRGWLMLSTRAAPRGSSPPTGDDTIPPGAVLLALDRVDHRAFGRV